MKKTLFFGILAMLISFAANKASAQTVVTYFDEYGDEQTHEANKIDVDVNELSSGWYYVESFTLWANLNIPEVTISGNVYLILRTSSKLTISKLTITEGSSFTIYSYTNSELVFNTIDGKGTFIVNSGKVTGTSINSSYVSTEINGGEVNVSEITVKELTINGGKINDSETTVATVANKITLSWNSESDEYYLGTLSANTLEIADGKVFVIDGKEYSGTIDATDIAEFTNKTLTPPTYPVPNITLTPIAGIKYDGEPHQLLTIAYPDGEITDGQLLFSVDGDDTEWSSLPMATNIGNHSIKYKIISNTPKYVDSESKSYEGEVEITAIGSSTVNGIYYVILDDENVQVGDGKDCAWPGTENPEGGKITIPATVSIGGKTYTVSKIGDNAFNSFKYGSVLKEVDFAAAGNSIKTIGANAFSNNTALKKVNLDACTELTTIGGSAFAGSNGFESITIPSKVKVIGNCAFCNCAGLKSVTIAEGSVLETIGESAFYCTAITEITLPASIKSIGNSAFFNYYPDPQGFTLTCKAIVAPSLGTEVFSDKDIVDKSTLVVPPCGSGYDEWKQYFEDRTVINVTETSFSESYHKEYDGTAIFTYAEDKRPKYTYSDGVNSFSITSTAITFFEKDEYFANRLNLSPSVGKGKLVKVTYDMSQTTGDDVCTSTSNVITLSSTNNYIEFVDDVYLPANSGSETVYVGVDGHVDVGDDDYDAGDDFVWDPEAPTNGSLTIEDKYGDGEYKQFYKFTTTNATAGTNYKLTSTNSDYPITINLHVGEPYAEFSSDGTTLYFRYGARPSGAFPIPEYDASPEWILASQTATVEKVVFKSVITPTTCEEWFREFTNLTTIDHIENLHTENVKDMSYMFDKCSKLAVIDISNFDMSSVEKMDYMFADCSNLTTILVKASQLDDSEDKYLKLKGNVSHKGVFKNCYNLIGNTGSLYDMVAKAHYAANVAHAYDDKEYDKAGEGGYLTIDKCKIFYDLYADDEIDLETVAGAITEYEGGTEVTLPTVSSDLLGTFGGWVRTTLNVEGTYSVVHASTPTNSIAADEKGNRIYSAKWAKAKEKYVFFDNNTLYFKYDSKKPSENAYSLNEGSAAPGWLEEHSSDIKKVVFETSLTPTTCYRWFYGCSNLKALDLTNIKTAALTNTESMFEGCNSLTAILVDNNQWSYINNYYITQSANMFNGCSSLIGEQGWFIDSDVVDKSRAFAEEEDYDGYFTMDYYKIFYDKTSGSDEIYSSDYDRYDPQKNDANVVLDIPTKDGSVFLGWKVATGEYNGDYTYENAKIIEDVEKNFGNYVIKATWGAAYAVYEDGTLTFKVGDSGSETGTVYTIPTDGSEPGWVSDNTNASITQVVFDSSFDQARPTSCASWFYECTGLTSLVGMKYLHTDDVTDMSNMFYKCKALQFVDLSQFNTAKVTTMASMFECCVLMRVLNLSSFNTEKVENMDKMFYMRDISTATQPNSLSAIYVGNGWQIGSETSSDNMFYAKNLVGGQGTKYDENYIDKTYARIDGGETSKGYLTSSANYGYAVYDGGTLTFKQGNRTAADLEYEVYDLLPYQKKVQNGSQSWYEDDVPAWLEHKDDITTVVFESGFDAVIVTTCKQWFKGCKNLVTINNWSNLNTSKATSFYEMFAGCEKIETINLSSFNTQNANNFEGMFMDCKKLSTLTGLNKITFNLDKYPNDGRVIDDRIYVNSMFNGCSSLEEIDVSHWSSTPITMYNWLFANCSSLKKVTVGSIVGTVTTDIQYMFYGCKSLEVLDISGFNTSYVEDMFRVFAQCDSLTTIKVGTGWSTGSITTDPSYVYRRSDMFEFDYNLIGNDGTICDISKYKFEDSNGDGSDDYSFNDSEHATTGEGGYLTTGNYKIFYDLNADDGEVNLGTIEDAATEYAGGTAVLLPATLADRDEGSGFQHWLRMTRDASGDIVTGTDAVTKVAADEIGNRIYSAKWEKSKLKYVYFDTDDNTLYFKFDANKPATNAYSLNKDGVSPRWIDDHSSEIENVVFETEFEPTTCYQWFKGCSKLTTLDLTNLKTSKVTNMESMFEGCSSLTALNIAHFKRDKLTNIKSMFKNCSSLTGILVDPAQWSREDMWDDNTNNLASEEMFAGCDMLIGNDGSWAKYRVISDYDYDEHTDDKWLAYAKTDDAEHYDDGNFSEGNFKIYYETDGGSLDDDRCTDRYYYYLQEYGDDDDYINLATPTKDGYVLAGWLQATDFDVANYKGIYPASYNQSDLITSVAKNSGNYRLKAVWKPKYNIFIPEGFAATDDSNDDITSAAEGQKITLTYTGTKYVKKVEVFPMPKSVSIDQAGALVLRMGVTPTLTCTILPTGIADEDKVVKWTSSDENIVKIGLNTGTMEGVNVGTAIITVETTNGKTATISVEVRDN